MLLENAHQVRSNITWGYSGFYSGPDLKHMIDPRGTKWRATLRVLFTRDESHD